MRLLVWDGEQLEKIYKPKSFSAAYKFIGDGVGLLSLSEFKAMILAAGEWSYASFGRFSVSIRGN